MRPEERDAAYLWDMLDAARKVCRFLEGVNQDVYMDDLKLQAATERCLEIIGEAAGRVSKSFQQAHPEIPWRKIIAQRNVLAHDYGDVMQDRVWEVATVHIPELIQKLEPIVPPPPPEPPE